MNTNPADRKRYASQPSITVGGLSRILSAFGFGSPVRGEINQNVSLDPQKVGGPYMFFQGDLFTPGTGNWALDPSFDGPMMTNWGHAFLRRPNSFRVHQSPQVYTAAASAIFGVGGQVPGQFITQPLSDDATLGGQ